MPRKTSDCPVLLLSACLAVSRQLQFPRQSTECPRPQYFLFPEIPRVISNNALVWSMVEFGRISELQLLLAGGQTSPHDVSELGTSILYVSAHS